MSSQNKRIPPYHKNGTAGAATPVDLTYQGDGKTLADYITINAKGPNELQISFDKGVTWATVAAGNSFDLEWRLDRIDVKSSGACDYEIICVSGKLFRPHVI